MCKLINFCKIIANYVNKPQSECITGKHTQIFIKEFMVFRNYNSDDVNKPK